MMLLMVLMQLLEMHALSRVRDNRIVYPLFRRS